MESNKNLVLVGMMGSGKSTIGYLLSKKLNLKFIDIDRHIEEEVGLKINDIFNKKGEVYFREIEKKVSLRYMKLNKHVVALGGGGFMNENIRTQVISKHISFWLNWNNEILLNRIKNSKKRPLAFSATENELIDLIKKRSNIYSKALYEIKCDKLSKSEIVKKVLKNYETH